MNDPATVSEAIQEYTDFSQGRAVVERPDRVRDRFDNGDELVAAVQAARDAMDAVRVDDPDPLSAGAQAQARERIAAALPWLSPSALDTMLSWWTDHNLW